MAKFCSQCGKPLEEGEVCECQQQKAAWSTNMNEQQNVTWNPNANVQQGAEWNANMNAQQNQAETWNPNMNTQQNQTGAWNSNMNTQQNQAGAWNPNMNTQQNQAGAWNSNMNAQQNQGATWNQNMNPQQGAAWSQNENIQKSAELIKKEGISVLNRTINLFKKPIDEIKNMANSDNIMAGLSAVICNMVVILLISIICMIAVDVQLGDFSSFIEIPYVKIVFMAVLLSAIYDFGLAGSMFLTVKTIFKENTTFAKMLSVVGGKVLIDSVFIVAGCILMLLNGQLGMFVIALGMIFSSIVLMMGFYEVSALDSNKKVFAYFIALVIFIIGLAIIYYVIAKSAIDDITKAFKYLL